MPEEVFGPEEWKEWSRLPITKAYLDRLRARRSGAFEDFRKAIDWGSHCVTSGRIAGLEEAIDEALT